MSANEPITRGECERVHNGLKDQFDEIKTGIDKIWVKVDAQKSGNGFVQAMHELPTFMKTVLTMIPVVIVLLGYFGFKPGEMKPEAVKAIVSQAVQDMEKIAPAQVPAWAKAREPRTAGIRRADIEFPALPLGCGPEAR